MTFVLFHPLAFGLGSATAVVIGGTLSKSTVKPVGGMSWIFIFCAITVVISFTIRRGLAARDHPRRGHARQGRSPSHSLRVSPS